MSHEPGPHVDQDLVLEEVEEHADPAVVEAVQGVRDRFGARGLRDLITIAQYELDVAEQAGAALRAVAAGDDGSAEGLGGSDEGLGGPDGGSGPDPR